VDTFFSSYKTMLGKCSINGNLIFTMNYLDI